MFCIGDEFGSDDDLKETVSAFERAGFVRLNVIDQDLAIDSTAKRAPSKVYNENLRYREIDFVCAHGGKCSDCIFRVNGRGEYRKGLRKGAKVVY